MDDNLDASERVEDRKLVDCDLKKDLNTDMSVQPLVRSPKITEGSMEDFLGVNTNSELGNVQKNNEEADNEGKAPEGNEEDTRKGIEENINMAGNRSEIQTVDHTDALSKLHLTDGRKSGDKFIKDDEHTDQDSGFTLNKVSSLSDYVADKVKAIDLLHSAEVSRDEFSSDVKAEKQLSSDLGQCLRTTPIASTKRKLLVLDVNGLLAYIVMPAPKDRRSDVHVLGRAVFKRPFCDDFLKFCFKNFDVAIWSSRSKRVIDRVVSYLLGNLKDKLLFSWNMDHSTQTGFKTLENIHKPLVCKELKKIWENDDPNSPWKKGDYNESNTLLLDDSPYKALLNPKHTAIFPNSYHYQDQDDNALGPGGDLRVYLEGLIASENVQDYVKQNPYGQSEINETNLSWDFYSEVLQAMSNLLQENIHDAAPNLSSQ